jgi:DNA repair ATPase RecN
VTYIDSGSTGWSTSSSRAVKTSIDPVDPEDALAGVESLEVATWEYEDEDGEGAGTTHIGPMAEEFHDAFDVGSSDEHINSINADGVAFAALQGLSAKLDRTRERLDGTREELNAARNELDEREERIDELAAASDRKDERIEDLEAETERLTETTERLRERNADLEDRLAAVEARLGLEDATADQTVADD